MEKQLFYVPIIPSTGQGSNVESIPYQAPEFWPVVNVLREVMYRFKSQTPRNNDLPRLGIDKQLDKQINLYIERKWGNKNVSIVLGFIVVVIENQMVQDIMYIDANRRKTICALSFFW